MCVEIPVMQEFILSEFCVYNVLYICSKNKYFYYSDLCSLPL